MDNPGTPTDRQLTRSRRIERLEAHLVEVRNLLKNVLTALETSSSDLGLMKLRNDVCKHETEAQALLDKLGETETLLDQLLAPMQHLSKIKQLEKELYAYDEAYETLTKQRQGHQKVFEAYTGSAGATDHDGSGQKSFFPSKSDKNNTVKNKKDSRFLGETTDEGGSRSPTSPTLKRIQESIFPSKSETVKAMKHMKSSPTIRGSESNQPTPTVGAGNNLNIPFNYQALHRSFADLQSSYAAGIKDDAGRFSSPLPGSKVASKKGTPDMNPSSPDVGQEESMSPGSPALGYIGQQNSVVDANTNTDTPKWTPGGPILRPESYERLEKLWAEEDRQKEEQDALQKTASGNTGASSTYHSYAPVKHEYDMYNPPPREPTPPVEPRSLPPPPRRRRQLAPIVTESEPKEEPKEEGNETVVRHRKKGKSKTRSPRSAKGNTSPRTPSEVTENVFGAPESGEDSNPWPKQGLMQIQGRDADDPLARGRESFEAA